MKHPDARIESLLNELVHSQLAAIDLSLDRMRALMAALGNPQDKLPPVVHVAGTNGKGSLLAYLTAIVQAAGYKVHRYTSPHLVRFNERIMLADKEIEDAYLLSVLERLKPVVASRPVTFFEVTTAAAFMAFAETPADIVLLETGLGGRLDATNIIPNPLLTAITPVSMDHTEYLGHTIAAIAGEKAGIIKQNVPCVMGPQISKAATVIVHAAEALQAPLLRYGKEWTAQPTEGGFHFNSFGQSLYFPLPNLPGAHQIANAATAIACTQEMQGFTIHRSHMAQGITHAIWPARLQRIEQGTLSALLPQGSELWLDGGHNPSAGAALAEWVKSRHKPVHVLCGMLKNKDIEGFLTPLAPHIKSLTPVAIPGETQGQAPEAISAIASRLGIKTTINEDIRSSIQHIVTEYKNESIILICGSLYLAGYILWQNNQNP